jgi:flagellar P-ring protein precursor FlgI
MKAKAERLKTSERTTLARPVFRLWILAFGLGLLGFSLSVPPAAAEGAESRIKDLASVRGVRSNFLNGLGLVVGLKGTGDSNKSLATNRAIASMLTRLGMQTKASEVAAGNMAAVMVTAELPAFARIGAVLDVKVSAIGDAKSLAGGTLILTPLRAGDSEVYAVAQGAVVVGQASGNGPQVLTVARVPAGGSVEREFMPKLGARGLITLALKEPDFTTATRIAEKINGELKEFAATARDVASVEVMVPPEFQSNLVAFVAELEAMRVAADGKATVVVNERTGTVVMGRDVVIHPVAIAHGDLSIKIDDPKAKKQAGKGASKSVVALGGATVGDLLETMNALGVKPADLIGILQTLHAAGALKAELRFL